MAPEFTVRDVPGRLQQVYCLSLQYQVPMRFPGHFVCDFQADCGGMRRLLHLTLTVCLSLYVMSTPVMWGVYYLFADQIAASYCVNRANSCCHGKCHVGKVTD